MEIGGVHSRPVRHPQASDGATLRLASQDRHVPKPKEVQAVLDAMNRTPSVVDMQELAYMILHWLPSQEDHKGGTSFEDRYSLSLFCSLQSCTQSGFVLGGHLFLSGSLDRHRGFAAQNQLSQGSTILDD